MQAQLNWPSARRGESHFPRLVEIDELAGIVGTGACEELDKAAESGEQEALALRNCFAALMNSSEESIASALKRFEDRIPSLSPLPSLLYAPLRIR